MIEAAVPETMHRPTAREVRILHEAVKELTEKLHKERFDVDLVWDKGDDFALDRYLQISVSTLNPWPKAVAEVESCIRAYFASEGILGGERPYQWLPNLGKYCGGPLNKNGEVKSLVEAQRAEADAKFAASVREAEERKRADVANDRGRLLARVVFKVAEDLRARGFETFKPIGASSYLVAMDKSVNTRNAPAMRIVVRASAEELTRDSGIYQAVADPDQDVRTSPVVYHPPLQTE
jgi:hypothetical protein